MDKEYDQYLQELENQENLIAEGIDNFYNHAKEDEYYQER